MRSMYPMLRPGDWLGDRYRIIRMLGQGGMGAVFLAEDSRLPGKQWAVKEVAAKLLDRDLLADEARFLAECSHPGLASVADFLRPGNGHVCYLVMDYIRGETLEALRRRGAPLGWETVSAMALELLEVLAYLHEGRPQAIIHRDLKPSNIMLDGQGRIKLIDFGTARHYKTAADRDTVCLGTPGFAAPEQLLGRQTDARTDLYALGAVMLYLLDDGMNSTDRDLPASERLSCLSIPSRLAGFMERLLAENPESRYARAADAADDLADVLEKSGSSASPRGYPGLQGSARESISGSGAGSKKPWIVVGGITEGSGAGFVSVALARVLNRRQVEHAVVEHPGIHPDLYQTLFGEQYCPRGYSFPVETIRYVGGVRDCGHEPAPRWKDGATEWVPLPPAYHRDVTDWTREHTRQLLERTEHPLSIIDVGACWGEESVQWLCRQAAVVLLVCGPSPVHLSRPEAARVWHRLTQLREEGVRVQVIANRSCVFPGREEWLRSLPDRPAVHLPEIPTQEMLACQWTGKLAADRPKTLQVLEKALEPVVMPILAHISHPGQRAGFWRLFRRKAGAGV